MKNNPKKPTTQKSKAENLQIVPCASNPSSKKLEQNTDQKNFWANTSVWIVFFTGLTVAATGIAAYFQWETSQPFVYLKSVKIQPGDSSNYDIVGEWENSGNSMATDAQSKITWVGTNIEIVEDDAYRSLPIRTVPFYIAPHSSVIINYDRIPKICLDNFMAGKIKKFYIWGFLTYKNSFPLKLGHITRFCYDIQRVLPENTGSFTLSHAFCDTANCADGGCDEHQRGNARLPVAACE